MALTFDDLIPSSAKGQGQAPAALSFDDLIPNSAAHPQGQVSPSPAAVDNPVPVGGDAAGTVPILPDAGSPGTSVSPTPDLAAPGATTQPVFSSGKPAQPSDSIMGGVPAAKEFLKMVSPDFIDTLANELIKMTPEQRVAVIEEGGVRGRTAQILMEQAAVINSKQAEANTPERISRREFAKENPMTGALGAGAAQTLRNTLNIPSVAADFVNQTFVNPILNVAGVDPLKRVGTMPGTDYLTQASQDFMPPDAKLSLADAIKQEKFTPWFLQNMAAQSPQIAQTITMAMNPALRGTVLPAMGGQEAAGSFLEGDDSRLAAVKGTIATLAEMLPLKAFDAVRDRILALPLGAQANLLTEATKRLLASGAAVTVQGLTGSIEETLTELGKNTADNILTSKSVPMMQNVPEAAVLGFGTGGVMATPNVATALTKGDTNSPEAQIANAINDNVANTSIDPAAVRRVAVDLLNPDNAQMRVVPVNFDDLVPNAPAPDAPVPGASEPPAAPADQIDPAGQSAVAPAPVDPVAQTTTPVEPAPRPSATQIFNDISDVSNDSVIPSDRAKWLIDNEFAVENERGWLVTTPRGTELLKTLREPNLTTARAEEIITGFLPNTIEPTVPEPIVVGSRPAPIDTTPDPVVTPPDQVDTTIDPVDQVESTAPPATPVDPVSTTPDDNEPANLPPEPDDVGVAEQIARFNEGVFAYPGNVAGQPGAGRDIAMAANARRTANYVAAAKQFLEGSLDTKPPTGKNTPRISPEMLYGVKPQPVKTAARVAKTAGDTQKALFSVAGNGDIRYYLNGIKIERDSNTVVATDGHRMVAVEGLDLTAWGDPAVKPAQDEILGRDGKLIEGKFPDWRRVVPDLPRFDDLRSFNSDEVAGYTRGTKKAWKYISSDNFHVVPVTVGDTTAKFNGSYIADMAELFKKLGYDTFNAQIVGEKNGQKLVAVSPDGKVRQVVMSTRDGDREPLFAPLVTNEPPVLAKEAAPAKPARKSKKQTVKDILMDAGVDDPGVVDAVVAEYDQLSGEQDDQGSGRGDNVPGDTVAGVSQRGNEDGDDAAAADSEQDNQQPGQDDPGQAVLPGFAKIRRSAQNEAQEGSGDTTQSGEVDERTSRSEGNDTRAAAQGDQRRGQNNGREENQRVKGASSDNQFNKASFTDRQSIYRDAFVELGYDPAETELLPPERQFTILSEGLKKSFGLAFVEKSKRANIRDSIDQLLDAYRGMQLMAHVLDLPTTSIGLDAKLGLVMTKRGDFLGAYFPQGGSGKYLEGLSTNDPTIVMPGRSNSFSHEWGHALDYYIIGKYNGSIDNLSGMVRKGESLSSAMPETIRDSYRLLMNSLFFDNAEFSARILDLERRIEASEQKGVDPTALKRELRQLQSGASQSPQGRSDFYKNSGDFSPGTADYWRKPTEMLARSFEAYIAHKVEAAGGTTEFIAKGDYAYQSDADDRLRMTFPKDSDRYNIFRAYDLLFDAIREEEMLSLASDTAAGMPAGIRLSDPSVYFDVQINNAKTPLLKRLWQAEKREWRLRSRQNEKIADRPQDERSLLKKMGDATSPFLQANRGALLSLQGQYAKSNPAAAKAIGEVIKRIATDPGSGNETFKGGVYAEAVSRETRRFMTRLSNIQENNGIAMFSDADLTELANVLTTIDDEAANAPEHIKRAAAPLRELLTDLYYYNRSAGMDIGFVKDQGYLPRLLDEPVVTANATEFMNDAAKVYRIIYDRDTMRPSDADDIAVAIKALDKRIVEARLSKNDPRLDEYKAARKQLNKLLRQLDAAKGDENDPEGAAEDAQEALDQFLQQNMDTFDDAYDVVGDEWSKTAASDWQTRITYGSPENFTSHSPAGSYLKERTLPPQADKILAKYYIQDPVDRISRYLNMSVRKAEYNLRFGKDVRARGGNTQLYTMLNGMIEAGVSKHDREMIERIIGQVTGTDRSSIPHFAQRMVANVHGIGQMALLGRVVLTSVAEPITTAVQTGRPLDALRSLALTFQEVFNTGSVKERRALAQALGIISGDLSDEIIANRLGGTQGESAFMQRASAAFFRRVGLTGLTNAQRRSAMVLSGRYVLDMAHALDDPESSANEKGYARDELIDAGLNEKDIDDFVAWSRAYDTKLPRFDELIDVDGQLTDMGKIFAVLTGRLTDQAIQNPTAIDRPWAANTTFGRITYGLLSFSTAFFRNVIVKSAKKIEREYSKRGLAQATKVATVQVLAPMATLYAGHFVVTMARELMLNPERWKEEEKKAKGFPIGYLSSLAFSRSGFTGLADPLYNAWTGVKYQRDLANILGGATGAYTLQAAEKIARYFVSNSPNTNSAERAAVRGAYELTLQPLLAVGAGYLPGGPVVGYGLGASYAYLSSPAFKSQLQDILAGKSNTKKGSKSGSTRF